ncbi:MAG: iron-containing alcohol dehydrogenase, partial [Chloroflexia bacterium]|nr:iron-containing alcohol dehydrogenase [Chloroflexia bacterium]
PITDSLAFEALAGLAESIELAYMGSDLYVKTLEARKRMSYASMISGITLANAGLGLVHGLASTIGGYFNIPHGVVCGTLMGAASRATIRRLLKENPQSISLTKYANVGMLFSSEIGKSNEFYCLALCDKIDELLKKWTCLNLEALVLQKMILCALQVTQAIKTILCNIQKMKLLKY